jgi:hypothetical protein
MKTLKYFLFFVIISISTSVFSQQDNYRKVRLKGTKYKIEIPKKYKLKRLKGIDFLFYSIISKSKKDSIKEIGIYLGYFPNEKSDTSFKKIDSLNIDILKVRTKFILYKSNNSYLIEGFTNENKHIIETNIYHEEKMQFHMYGKTISKDALDRILRIFQSLRSVQK